MNTGTKESDKQKQVDGENIYSLQVPRLHSNILKENEPDDMSSRNQMQQMNEIGKHICVSISRSITY